MWRKIISIATSAILTSSILCNSMQSKAESEPWGIDVENYNEVIKSYAVEYGNNTDRFNFPNLHYKWYDGFNDYGVNVSKINEDDKNYIEYLKKCSNIEASYNPLNQFTAVISSGLCLGISSLSILTHNGIITPSDIQPDNDNLIDITVGNDVMSSLISYHSRQTRTDFRLFMNWSFFHYTDEERIDDLINQAEKADDEGKYFLILLRSNKSFNHAVTGIGMLEGNFESDGEIYDKCILTYDSNAIVYDENGKMKSGHSSCHTCIFINSETKKTYHPGYFDETGEEEFSYLAISDYDFINSNGMYNPSSKYSTNVSDINSIEIKSDESYDLTLKRNDDTEYDGVATSNNMFGTYNHGLYFCDGKEVRVKNSGDSELFKANITNPKNYFMSDFNGSVDNIIRNESEFSFDTKGETEYDVSLIFEEGCYSFAPHYRYDFSGVTDSDFITEQTDNGVILRSSNGIKCALKTSDVKRDENNMLISAEDNIQNDAINTRESVMLGFDDNVLKYYIGENFDVEVEKGDVNCDGKIDASDASAILASYADASTGKTQYIGCTLGDYNNDGKVDASDASGVLAEYARRATIS